MCTDALLLHCCLLMMPFLWNRHPEESHSAVPGKRHLLTTPRCMQDIGKVMQPILGTGVLLTRCSCWYSDAEDATQQLLGSADTLLGCTRLLPPHMLEAVRMKDANQHDPSWAAVQSVEFHPLGQLLMTAGLDKRLHLFQV